ncbi:2-haloacid dehalogenase [Aliiroseovarius halocynthiae]|uniref:(S)-2-haloacid dehalogenase n=1 Tax=Aliiroseovarius halocynthiae TaxID=985055 RepID=A0A545SQ29_9RHOB|nr:haloacid dehalogenase type II [Aliiroseovarius halocynthiae]TQV67082.1 haloacid dehalogenase type II [Aliiroseovarius halocynthiae]SMR82195.1 2-haloacid dehalogenase [Aliiroseovarius halocynthiae]
MPIKAIAFDAYGTLLDVYSVGALAEEFFPGKGATIAAMWRDKQIEYTRLRTMCDRYADFWQVTGDGLDYACEFHKVVLTVDQRAALMGAYETLTAFDENHAQMTRLKAAGVPMAILSNGTRAMIDSALQAAGLEDLLDHVLSVDTVGKFKTAPEAYQMGSDAFGCDASEILFVSSNCWDICGATWFGYHTIWLNRAGLPIERLGVEPMARAASLHDVADYALASFSG